MKAGLISKKQADETERKIEHQERQSRHASAQGSRAPSAHRRGAQTGGKPHPKTLASAAGRGSPGAASRPPEPASHAPGPAPAIAAAAVPTATSASLVQSAKLLRDQALNRQQQEKAAKKAKIATIRQMIEQNRLTSAETGDPYHFVDGTKIRQIPVDAGLRARLVGGELGIVRYYGRYDIVPTALIARLRERDDQVCVAGASDTSGVAEAEAKYPGFAVPDDLIW